MTRSSSAPSVGEPSSEPLRLVGHAVKVGPSVARAPRQSGEDAARRRFRAARHKIGMGQTDAAIWLGVAESTLADWERGASRIPAWALVEIERRAA